MLEKNKENHMSSNSKFTESKPKHTEMESHKKYILKKIHMGMNNVPLCLKWVLI